MSKRAEIANDRAIEYWEQNRFDDAIAQWEAIVRRDPNLAEIHYNLGNAYMYQGKVESAIEALKQALRINPNFEEARRNVGLIQNLPQLDLDDEIPAYQHVTEDDESASIEGDNDPPRWRNRISRGWGAFRKK